MTTLRRILTGATLMLVAAGLASANSIFVNCSIASGSTELGLSPNTSGLVNCAGDGGLNPLFVTSIEITIDGAVISPSTITLINNDANSHNNFSGTTDAGYTIDGTTPLPGVTLPVDGLGHMFDVFAGTGSVALAPCTSGTTPCTAPAGAIVTVPVTGAANSGALSVTAGSFGNYESAFHFVVDTNTSINLSFGGANGSGNQTTFASATAVVEYDYTVPGPTPEPTTMALTGGALLGLGLIRKRFRKSSHKTSEISEIRGNP
jgi:hypothetical protein